MPELYLAKKLEISDPSHPQAKGNPQECCRIEREVMQEPHRHATKQRLANRIQYVHQPLVVLRSVDPDQNAPPRVGGFHHLAEREFRKLEVVDHTDREYDIEEVSI